MVNVKIFGETMPNDVEKGSGKGIHIIADGWCLSAQAGWGNYCSEDPSRCHINLTPNTIRTDCEIALWENNGGELIRLREDTVMGWVCWDMVFDIVEWLRKQKEIPTETQVRNKVVSLKNKYDIEEK